MNSYVYFALSGDDFDPKIIGEKMGIAASDSWKKGDVGVYKIPLNHSCWKLLRDEAGKEINELLDDLIETLFDKIALINELKHQYKLGSTLEIVLYIDFNEEKSTPSLVYMLKTIEFLHKTETEVDVDIYRFHSHSEEKVEL